jgi:hypothetical protein
MLTVICPNCNTVIPASAHTIGSLPPTGGDYEWQESDAKHTCPNCAHSFEMRVRTSLETGGLLFVRSSPKPAQAGIVWYAIASLQESYRAEVAGEQSVQVSSLCQDEATADIRLFNDSKKYYRPLQILKVTQAGYFDLAGKEIIEPSYYKGVINYLELG